MIFPTRKEIVKLNLYHIQHTGGFWQGPDNLLNPNSLEWVLEAIQYPLFGIEQYPTLVEKTAILTWTIIAGHVFHDANKRTGISALKIFLRVNGYELNASDDEFIEVALLMASNKQHGYTRARFTQWLREHLRHSRLFLRY